MAGKIIRYGRIIIFAALIGLVAQLDRVPVSEAVGWRFDPSRDHNATGKYIPRMYFLFIRSPPVMLLLENETEFLPLVNNKMKHETPNNRQSYSLMPMIVTSSICSSGPRQFSK